MSEPREARSICVRPKFARQDRAKPIGHPSATAFGSSGPCLVSDLFRGFREVKYLLIEKAQGCCSCPRINQSQQEPMGILKTAQKTIVKWVKRVVHDALQNSIEHVAYGFDVL